MKKLLSIILSLFTLQLFAQANLTPIPLDDFKDLIHHGLKKFKDEQAPYERWTENDVTEIADNLLAFQNPDGGWGKIGRLSFAKSDPVYKNVSYQDILVKMTPQIKASLTEYLSKVKPVKFDSIKTEKSTRISDKIEKPRSVLDNQMTYSHIRYLTKVYNQTGQKKYLESAFKGLKWILDVQLPCGGWSGSDVYGICNNDNVTSGVLEFLQDILHDDTYAPLKKKYKKQCQKAHDKAIQILLRTQVVIDGKKTIWAHNYDPDTLEPISARPFEPAALSVAESIPIIRVLMKEPEMTPQIKEALTSAADFLKNTKFYVTGELKKVPVAPHEENGLYIKEERIFTPSPEGAKYTPRFLSIPDLTPLYGDWKGNIYKDYNQVPAERRTGYSFLQPYNQTELEKLCDIINQ